MLLIDTLVVIAVLGVVIFGALSIRAVRRKAKPEIVGAENAEEVIASGLRRCQFCRKDTDPKIDIYSMGRWYHRTCFLNRDNKANEKVGKV